MDAEIWNSLQGRRFICLGRNGEEDLPLQIIGSQGYYVSFRRVDTGELITSWTKEQINALFGWGALRWKTSMDKPEAMPGWVYVPKGLLLDHFRVEDVVLVGSLWRINLVPVESGWNRIQLTEEELDTLFDLVETDSELTAASTPVRHTLEKGWSQPIPSY